MKLIYTIGSLDRPGGTEKVLANKANYFAEVLGYEVHIFINDQANKDLAYHFSDRIIFHDMSINSYSKQPHIPLISGFFLKIKLLPIYQEKIDRIKPDVIIVTQHGIDSYIVPKLKTSAPIVREFHSSLDVIHLRSNFINNFIKRKLFLYQTLKRYNKFDKFDYVVFLTENEKNKSNLKTNKIVISNMLENAFAKKEYNTKKNIISVGSMRDMGKRFDVQIRMWKKIIKKFPDWKLNIYGDGKEREKLQSYINELGLNKSVLLHGNAKNIHEKYNNADFFLLTSMAEGFSMVVIESIAHGLPVVTFDCPEGPGEIVRNNIDGFVVENNNEEELLKKVIELISDSLKREVMGNNAYIRSKDYLPENISKSWIDFFNQIINNEKINT